MKKKHLQYKASFGSLNKLGIFSAALLAAITSVCLYSPVDTNANATGAQVEVSFTVNPKISMAIEANGLNFAVSTTREGKFVSGDMVAIVDTSSTGGYELAFSADDDYTAAVAPGSNTPILSDFAGSVTSSTMPKDKWGYSLNNIYFSKIPGVSSPKMIRNIDHHPSSIEMENHLYIGAKLSSALESGTYKKAIVFTATAHDDLPLDPSLTMQGFNPKSLTAVESTATITDTRDGSVYTVKKAADGNVWMMQNLRIAGAVLTPEDSDVSSRFSLPASSLDGFSEEMDSAKVYVDDNAGGYYNFYAATAGTGGTSLNSGNAPSSICPKGWRLPTKDEYVNFYNFYHSKSLVMSELGLSIDGYVNNRGYWQQGSMAYWWSSTADSNYSNGRVAHAFTLLDNSTDYSSVYADGNSGKAYGYNIRCIARVEPQTLREITSMQQMTSTIADNTAIGEAATLVDERDGRTYTVKKLADGKIWMTQNLRIVNKTISSADSDLPSGDTWTIPASDLSSFNAQYNVNSAFSDEGFYSVEYGGYYSFYTATAGWGDYDRESGSSPKSICPKGWRLPANGSSGDFQKLYEKYPSVSLLQGEPGLTLGGHIYSNFVNLIEEEGNYWTSTIQSKGNAHRLVFGYNGTTEYVNPGNWNSEYRGYLIRCLAR